MTRKTVFAAAILAATAIGGAAFAASDQGHKHQPGQSGAQGMAHGGGSGMMHGGGSGMMHGGGSGMMGGMSGMMGGMSEMRGMMQRMHDRMNQMMDVDGDGKVTPDELRTRMQAALKENDTNGDGNLSLDEFEALHSAMMREMTVDRFQHLDADGDGAITPEEMMAPADKMERMQKMRGGMKKHNAKPDSDDSTDN